MKSKEAKEIAENMETVYLEVKAKNESSPTTLTTDQGKEFVNKNMKELNKKYKLMNHYTVNSKLEQHPTITSIVERFNRTLWNYIRKYQEANKSLSFIKELHSFIENYNNKEHSTTLKSPSDVFNKNEIPLETINKATNFEVGDLVRISLKKSKFSKSYEPKYSKQVYEVVKIDGTEHILKDLKTGKESEYAYQPRELLKIPKETINEEGTIEDEKKELKSKATTKRKNLKSGLDVDKEGNLIVKKKLVPKHNTRIRKKVNLDVDRIREVD